MVFFVMSLYLKYRPQNLDELDSEEVRESLKKIFSQKGTPHAFLFAGPKGTGKTSAARIVAKILNCEASKPPCGKCEQCVSIMKGNNIDVVEIDAASHGLVEDIRALRDTALLSPAKARKKIYIIDEAHMLSAAGSNALLKILEEPPSHVVFILATTNPEKLIGTIRSRTTEIQFKKAADKEIERSLVRVIKGEKIDISQETLSLIVKRANGSFRDAIKALEQFTLEGADFLEKGLVDDVSGFVELILKKDLGGALSEIKKRASAGFLMENFMKGILSNLEGRLLADEGEKEELISLIELMINAAKQIPDSPIEELPLEIAVFKWCQAEKNLEASGLDLEERSQNNGDKDKDKQPKIRFKQPNSGLSEEVWKSILAATRPINASIEALLRAARPIEFDGKTLKLGVFYRFHKERLEEVAHRRILEDVVAKILGSPVRVSCTLMEIDKKEVSFSGGTVLTEVGDQDIIKTVEEVFSV